MISFWNNMNVRRIVERACLKSIGMARSHRILHIHRHGPSKGAARSKMKAFIDGQDHSAIDLISTNAANKEHLATLVKCQVACLL